MATADRDDLVSQLRALDEQLAGVPPRPRHEARLRARLREAAAPARPALRDVVGGARRPIAAGLVAFAAVALCLDDGARRAAERWGAAARRLTAPAEPIAGEPPAPLDPAEPEAVRPSAQPPPAPVAPAPAPDRRARPRDTRLRPEDRTPAELPGPARAAPASPRRASDEVYLPERRPAPAPPRAPGELGPSGRRELPLFPAAGREAPADGIRGRAGGEERAERAPAEVLDADCTDAASLIEEARAACEAQERDVAEVALRSPCGEGLFAHVEYRCAEPEPAECFSGAVGDQVTCHDPGMLKEEANAVCVEAGQSLADFQYVQGEGGCEWRIVEAKYTCCPPSGPPPPPPPSPEPPADPSIDPSCKTGVVGDGVTCEDPGVLKDEAYQLCESAGLDLGQFDAWSTAACGGYALEAKFTCCPEAPAP
ncbi:uncharacterized protein SOCE26_078530 [Sorangium cellulosum]|uniref:Uncharacterized protein n=1 Tax=Sorangium cellulosum TaxID=56 RepID=A0A2L0F489_SORCE|nr:hypothetical protein [Sorangium cellulosum]AUX46347.1 uncharacterized protein SOCE26_078530 [Sorangium cellulosum]